jgi:hypothetical protein
MTYLAYREKPIPFGKWEAPPPARNEFAVAHGRPTKNYEMKWDDFERTGPGLLLDLAIRATPGSQPADSDQAATCGLPN